MKYLLILAVTLFTVTVSAEMPRTDYETIAASQTDQVLGPTGGAGDILETLVIIPATTGAGTVQIQDGAGTEITVFATGTLADLSPIVLHLHMRSTAGAWKITTGANVSAIGIGRFK